MKMNGDVIKYNIIQSNEIKWSEWHGIYTNEVK